MVQAVLNNPVIASIIALSILLFVFIVLQLKGTVKTKWFEISRNSSRCPNTHNCQFIYDSKVSKILSEQSKKAENYYILLGRFFYDSVFKEVYTGVYPEGDITTGDYMKQYKGMCLVFKSEMYNPMVQELLLFNGLSDSFHGRYIPGYISRTVDKLYTSSRAWWDDNFNEYNVNKDVNRLMFSQSEDNNKEVFYELTQRFLIECIIISLKQDMIYEMLSSGLPHPKPEEIEPLFEKKYNISQKAIFDKHAKENIT